MNKFTKIFLGLCVLGGAAFGAHYFGGSDREVASLASVEASAIEDFKEVKKIFDSSCVACHSCYNAACQLKLSSFEGIERGLHPTLSIYNNKRTTKEEHLTRLFIDADTSEEWHKEHGFVSILDRGKNILLKSLNLKLTDRADPKKLVSPEDIKNLTCTKGGAEPLPMPYGMPGLNLDDHETITNWVNTGNYPTKEDLEKEYGPSAEARKQMKEWEAYLNSPDKKQKLVSRYLFEHLFSAHIYFEGKPEFFNLVRSKTPTCDQVDEIPSRRPYDEPGAEFSYCFKKITSTIVHKTHITYLLDKEKRNRYKELFEDVKWDVSKLPSYDIKVASNPFETFKDIPADSRYQFLLDNAEYFVRTFIRGPVCRGSTAVNVINDQFFVMFVDPKAYAGKRDVFLAENAKYLDQPAQHGSDVDVTSVTKILARLGKPRSQEMKAIAKVMLDTRFLTDTKAYVSGLFKPSSGLSGHRIKYRNNRLKFFKENQPEGYGFEDIWDGGEEQNKNALLTVMRHYDSAAVVKGAMGPIPKTMWLIDFPLLESIYYDLVAGFDVYGDAGHQASTRYYMSSLRFDGEEHFLHLIPKEARKAMRAYWYRDGDSGGRSISKAVQAWYPVEDLDHKGVPAAVSASQNLNADEMKRIRKEVFESIYEKRYKKVFAKTGKDPVNAQEFSKITDKPAKTAAYVNHFPDLSFIRHNNEVYSLVRTKEHYNVTWSQDEDLRLDKENDVLFAAKGFVGSYPQQFFDISGVELNKFISAIESIKSSKDYDRFVRTYGIHRNSGKFWPTFKFMVDKAYEIDPIEAGVFDLNRYVF